MENERVLITVKTYPTLSWKYGETVCTAGVRSDGTWVRIYPVPFRRLDAEQQYKKFDWLECRLVRNTSDPRPETFRPLAQSELTPVAHMGTADARRDRRRLLLKTSRVYDRLDGLIEGAKANHVSLAVFKRVRVIDFTNYPKLPSNFSYRFEDATGRKSTLQIFDWEARQLYWNCLRSTAGDERCSAPEGQAEVSRRIQADRPALLCGHDAAVPLRGDEPMGNHQRFPDPP